MKDPWEYFKEELRKISIKLYVDLRRYLDEFLGKITKRKEMGYGN